MKNLLKDLDYASFEKSLTSPAKKGISFNALKMNKENFLSNFDYKLKEYSVGVDNFTMEAEEKLGNNIFHHAGAFYLQEPSAMVSGGVVPLKRGDFVLDACASPGGKTFQMAKRCDVTVVSNEIDSGRSKILNGNVERLGLKNVIVTNLSSEEIAFNYKNVFDVMLVDAPCSGEGMFRKESQAIDMWSEDYVKVCAERQKEILTNLDCCLKQGGYLMYSTCTYSVEENEEVVAFMCEKGYKVVDLGKINGSVAGIKLKNYNTQLAKRFYPHLSNGEGQFVCLLQKESENEETNRVYKGNYEIQPTQKRTAMQFFKENFTNKFAPIVENHLVQRGNFVYFCPEKDLLRKDLKVVSFGVLLGSFEKNRFEPNHNLWTAFGEYAINKVELTQNEAHEYIKGDSFYKDASNGWCVVTFKGCVLGGAKAVNGLIKNHYPKGLRKIIKNN